MGLSRLDCPGRIPELLPGRKEVNFEWEMRRGWEEKNETGRGAGELCARGSREVCRDLGVAVNPPAGGLK